MPKARQTGGYISDGYDPLSVPDAPTIGTATGGDESATVAFTAPSDIGGAAITAYYAVSNPGNATGTSASSPVTVSGLTNGTSYTFKVWAVNSFGPSAYSASSNSVSPSAPFGILAGGNTNTIEYISFETTGNASDFGDLTIQKIGAAAMFSTTRAVFSSGSTSQATMDYITTASTGNAAYFGDQSPATNNGTSGCSSPTRGIIAGGGIDTGSGAVNVIQYITTASLGNSSDFGDLIQPINNLNQGCSNGTRGIVAVGGYGSSSGSSNSINYITIASTGNATDFGDCLTASFIFGVCGSDTRGMIARGGLDNNSIAYITIASTGNATDFGDLVSFSGGDTFGLSNKTRAVFGKGSSYPMDYVTIASLGNATEFGSFSLPSGQVACGSSAQGGL